VASGKELSVPEDLNAQNSSADEGGLGEVSEEGKESFGMAGGETKTEDPTSTESKRKVKKQYLFKGEGSALAVQLFAIDEKYEMR